jgi:hypothetical protein
MSGVDQTDDLSEPATAATTPPPAPTPGPGHSPSQPPPPIFLPRHVVMAGSVLFVLGLIGTIVLVATQTTCNSATNLTAPGGTSISGACGLHHSYLDLSYIALFVGAFMIAFGGMLLPTLQAKRIRDWAAKHPPQN